MSLRSARLFVHVAASAGRAVLRSVGRGAVAGRAVAVPRIHRHEGALARVAARAQDQLVRRRLEVVRLMAARAGGAAGVSACVARGDLRVTGRARVGFGVHVPGVRFMARDARGLVRVSDFDRRVATGARRGGPAGVVVLVAARTDGVGRDARSQERLFRSMATDTHVRRRDEGVRFVAFDARIVARGLGPCGLLVAGAALLQREGGRRVWFVAVGAPRRARVRRVLGGELGVASRASLAEDGRIAVRAMALNAIGRRVGLRNRREASFGRRMTPEARRNALLRGEGMARQAIGHLGDAAGDEPSPLFGVAFRARERSGILESIALVVVAILAGHAVLADVLHMPEARPVLGPRRGDRVGRSFRRRGPEVRHEPDTPEDERARRGE
jgi:hypothetical protein